ncbi:PucR family transcriptional regulator [Corynebacterium hansenii]|uniref:PucR family transcriptional regulator n=1 Tax=Corynebacterium hansenii TaxID=394964 RepID=A0ABV7ZSG8_9CORY|nr:helix-turn-helix domain-containing protein [Corynebacterium hansenii]WJZ00972.1 carbohydrate diacid transcriptional activator CdaR [Corynebacterium hansenii]
MTSETAIPAAPVTPDALRDRWSDLLDKLGRDQGIVTLTVERLRATVPGYDVVPTEALAASARRNLDLSIRIIRAGGHPSPDGVPEAEALANERLRQGVSLGHVLSGFRTSMTVILQRLIELAPLSGIPADQVLECSTLLWSLGDVFSARATAVYRDREIARAVADSERKSAWIGAAVSDSMDPAELLRGAAAYDVPTDAPLRALAAPVRPRSGHAGEREIQRWAESAGARALTAVRSNMIVGILIGDVADDAEEPAMTVALGEPATLADLPVSFEAASRALRAADAVGARRLVDLESLSWRMGVHSSPDTTRMLRRRYIGALDGAGAIRDDILESVRAYLDNRMNIPAAAASIPVHVNTLRYRLRRFSELTGADLGDVDHLIEVSWAMASLGGGGRGVS